MLQSQQLIERVGRGHDLQLAGPQATGHAKHVYRHRLARGREGTPVADNDRYPAITRSRGAQGIGVHRGLAAGDLHHIAHSDIRPLGRVGNELSRDVGVLLEGVHHSGQAVHQSIPLGLLVGRRGRAEVEHRLQVLLGSRAPQDIELQVLLSHRLVLELTLQHEGSALADVGVEVHAGGQVRRQVGEVGEALVGLGEDAGGQLRQLDGSQRGALRPCGIDEHHAGFCQSDVVGGNGLLVEHLGAGLTADRRQPVHRPGEGLSRLKDRRQGRPSRAIDDVQGGGRFGGRVTVECRPEAGTKVRNNGAHRHLGPPRPSEALLSLVVEAHAEAVGSNGRLG